MCYETTVPIQINTSDMQCCYRSKTLAEMHWYIVWQFIDNMRHSVASRRYKIALKYGIADNGAISHGVLANYPLRLGTS